MYMILKWGRWRKNLSGKIFNDDDYLSCITDEDGSIRLFEKLEEADNFANNREDSDNLRVISIEGVQE